jgi:hypothetical protein
MMSGLDLSLQIHPRLVEVSPDILSCQQPFPFVGRDDLHR